jgi:hypothetical protein
LDSVFIALSSMKVAVRAINIVIETKIITISKDEN